MAFLDWKWRRKNPSKSTKCKSLSSCLFQCTISQLSLLPLLLLSIITLTSLAINTITAITESFESRVTLPQNPLFVCEAFQLIRVPTSTTRNKSHYSKQVYVPLLFQNSFTKTLTTSFTYNSYHQHNNDNLSSFCLYMGKGDGKKKRKKKSDSSTGTDSNTASASSNNPTMSSSAAPLRVTSDSIIPVRRQIQWAQMKKEAMKSATNSFRQTNLKRTSYRKSLGKDIFVYRYCILYCPLYTYCNNTIML